jgi:hypothetical protein
MHTQMWNPSKMSAHDSGHAIGCWKVICHANKKIENMSKYLETNI